MQGADQIVMAILPLVINRRPPLNNLEHARWIKEFACLRRAPEFLGKRKRSPPVPVRQLRQHSASIRIKR